MLVPTGCLLYSDDSGTPGYVWAVVVLAILGLVGAGIAGFVFMKRR